MKYREIKYGASYIGPAEKRAVMKVLNRNWWQLDKEGELMEKESAKFLGVKYGILTNSGSSAALLAMSSLELPKGSEVIIAATTFPTVFNVIIQCGLVPVVVDAKVGTYVLEISDVERAISKKTRAVWAVHAVGNPVDMPALMRLARKYKLYVLEDNCDGWGSEINGRRVGSFGHISITSFHTAHIVSMGEGGGVFTNSRELARRVRMYRDWGRQANIAQRSVRFPGLPRDYNARFVYEKIGYNLKPLELQAAVGRIQLRKALKFRELRLKNFRRLYGALSKYSKYLVLPRFLPVAKVCWFSFPLTVQGGLKRGDILRYLEKHGVETRTMFAGNIIRHPAYKKGVKFRVSGNLKGADRILRDSFWVSVNSRLSAEDMRYLIRTFDEFFKKYTK